VRLIAVVMDRLDDVLVGALERLRPPPQEPLSTWLEQHLRLPTGLAAEGGPIWLWKTQQAIADALGDPAIERVTLVKSARSGFSRES
jgi:phage terminase large subunit GpA-like protein